MSVGGVRKGSSQAKILECSAGGVSDADYAAFAKRVSSMRARFETLRRWTSLRAIFTQTIAWKAFSDEIKFIGMFRRGAFDR
jgi:hypothetical protein